MRRRGSTVGQEHPAAGNTPSIRHRRDREGRQKKKGKRGMEYFRIVKKKKGKKSDPKKGH